jgi:hypothetical protein
MNNCSKNISLQFLQFQCVVDFSSFLFATTNSFCDISYLLSHLASDFWKATMADSKNRHFDDSDDDVQRLSDEDLAR